MQTTGLTRNTIDKYYTKPEISELCVQHIQTCISIQPSDLIIEPSAGNGAFIPSIKQLSSHHLFYDLEPEHADIIKQDYLQMQQSPTQTIHVIGNPPFGRQSSIAIKFIKHSCTFCQSVSFILPKSFKKQSLKKTFPLSFHLIFEWEIPENSFLVDGNEHDVPCVFQIWVKRSYPRPIAEQLYPYHFEFVNQTDGPDISFRRVGVNAGVMDIQTEKKSKQSHYFIKFLNNKSVSENIELLSSIVFESNNTVGPKSISKQELILQFNARL